MIRNMHLYKFCVYQWKCSQGVIAILPRITRIHCKCHKENLQCSYNIFCIQCPLHRYIWHLKLQMTCQSLHWGWEKFEWRNFSIWLSSKEEQSGGTVNWAPIKWIIGTDDNWKNQKSWEPFWSFQLKSTAGFIKEGNLEAKTECYGKDKLKSPPFLQSFYDHF